MIRLAALAVLLLPSPRRDPIAFADATKEAGLLDPLAGMMGHGAAWGDLDGDGRPDLFVGGFCDRPNSEYAPADGPVPTRLFRSLGDGRFERARQAEFCARTSGAIWADLDNNGTMELYVSNNAQAFSRKSEEPQKSAQTRHSILFRNDKGTLVDVGVASGACPESLFTARNVGVFDYDGDGRLDLFLVEDPFKGSARRSLLLRNKGGLAFEPANAAAGLPDDIVGLGLAVADLNGDGRPDVFVADSNRLFLSRKDGTYREATELKALFDWHPVDGEDWPCGAAFGDVNRDGRLDLVVSGHHDPARVKLFLNGGLKDGVPQFRDVTKAAGLDAPIPTKAPHVELQDFDNDGWPDLYVSAAWLDDGKVVPLVFRHAGLTDGVPRFEPPRPLKGPMVYFPAGPSGDYDGDGRLDLFLVNWFQGNRCRLLHNESPRRHWLDVEVSGRTINRMGIGSVVRVSRSGRLLGLQEVTIGYGYASGQLPICHFGLGDDDAVDVEVALPNGTVVKKDAVPADRRLRVDEP